MSINRHTSDDDADSRSEREIRSDSPDKPTGEATSPENAPKNVPAANVDKLKEGKPANSAEAKPTERRGVPATPITPAPRPRLERVVTPEQEEAANRLERRRRRLRRGTDITPFVGD